MEKFVNLTSSGNEKAIKIGNNVPDNSVGLAWFNAEEMTPSNSLSLIDISTSIQENRVGNGISGEKVLAYADELGVLHRFDGSYNFYSNDITISNVPLTTEFTTQRVYTDSVDVADFIHYKYVSRYFISAPPFFSPSSDRDFLNPDKLSDLSIKVIDSEGFEYLDEISGKRKYRVLLEPFKTSENYSRNEVPCRVVVFFNADPPVNLKLVYDKVNSDEYGNIYGQELAYTETVNAVPYMNEVPEESAVVDKNSYNKNIFSLKKVNDKYSTLVDGSNIAGGYQIFSPSKGFSDYRTYEVFNWRLIAKSRLSINLDEIDFGDELDGNLLALRTVNAGVLYSSANQKTNSVINPYVFQRLGKSPFNLFRYRYVNPNSILDDTLLADYWKVDIDSVDDLRDYDVLVWSPNFKITEVQANKLITFLKNNGTIVLDLSLGNADATALDANLKVERDTVPGNHTILSEQSPILSSAKSGGWNINDTVFDQPYYNIFGSSNTARTGDPVYRRYRYFSSSENSFILSGFDETSAASSIGALLPYITSSDRLSKGNIIATTFPLLQYCNSIYSTSQNQEPLNSNYGDSSLDTEDRNFYSGVVEGPLKFMFNISAYATYCKAHSSRIIDTRSAVYNFVSDWNSSWVMNNEALLEDERKELYVNVSDNSSTQFYARDLIKDYPTILDFYKNELSKILPDYQRDRIVTNVDSIEIYIETTNPDVEVYNSELISNDLAIEDEDIPSSYTVWKMNGNDEKLYAYTSKGSPLLRVLSSMGPYAILTKPVSASGNAVLSNNIGVLNSFKSYPFKLSSSYSYVSVPEEKASRFNAKVNFSCSATFTATLNQPEEILSDPIAGEDSTPNCFSFRSALDDLGQGREANTSSPSNIFPYTGDIDLGNKTAIWANGNSGDYATYIQYTLWTYKNITGRNFYPYPLDGVYGSQTANGIRQFQQQEGARYIDGIVDSETKWLMARFWKDAKENHRGSYDQSVNLAPPQVNDRVRNFIIAAANTVTADKINIKDNYRKITFTGTVGPSEGIDYIYFSIPTNLETVNRIVIEGVDGWTNFKITEYGLSSSGGNDRGSYRKNNTTLNVSGGKVAIDINGPGSENRFGYIKVVGGSLGSKYGSRAEGFGIKRIKAEGITNGIPSRGTGEFEDNERPVSVDLVFDVRNIPVNGIIEVGAEQRVRVGTNELIKRFDNSDYSLKITGLSYGGRTYGLDFDVYDILNGREIFVQINNRDTIKLKLNQSTFSHSRSRPSAIKNGSFSVSKVTTPTNQLIWSSGSSETQPVGVTNIADGNRSVTGVLTTSQIYFADANVVSVTRDLSSGYSLRSFKDESLIYRDGRKDVTVNDGVMLLCDISGKPFGLPSGSDIAAAAVDNIDDQGDLRFGSFIISNETPEEGLVYGFYDIKEKEFLGKNIQYIDFVTRGVSNIFIGVCAIDADGNTQNDNEFIGPIVDTTFRPVQVPVKYVAPVYSISINTPSSIGIGSFPEDISRFETWELPVKNGSFKKKILFNRKYNLGSWEDNYLNQELLAEYSTLDLSNNSWSEIYGYGNYDVYDESPVLMDERKIRVRRAPILSWNHPTNYFSSIFGVVKPEFSIYIRDSIFDPWVAVPYSDIRDVNCLSGVIEFKEPKVPSDKKLIKISYTTQNKSSMIRHIDGSAIPINPVLNYEDIFFDTPMYVYILPKELYKRDSGSSVLDSAAGVYQQVSEYEVGSVINYTWDYNIFDSSSKDYNPLAIPIAIVYVLSRPRNTPPNLLDIRIKGGGVAQDKSNYELLNEIPEVLSNWDVYSPLGEAYSRGGYVIIRIPEEVRDNFIDEKEIYSVISNNLTAGIAYEIQDMNGNTWS